MIREIIDASTVEVVRYYSYYAQDYARKFQFYGGTFQDSLLSSPVMVVILKLQYIKRMYYYDDYMQFYNTITVIVTIRFHMVVPVV